MKTTLLRLSVLTAALILVGCGGSTTTDPTTQDTTTTDTTTTDPDTQDTTTTDTTTTTNSLSKISGTVPGTLIEAFCTDGSYYKVKSTDNNTAEHPFEIEVPNTVSCSLVMTTNEDDNASRVVTQIGMTTATASGTLFTAHADIDLGHIPLEMDYSKVTDVNGDHVSDDILNIQVDGTSIVVELENPLDDDNDGLVNIYEDDDDDDDDGDGIDDDLDDDNDGDSIDSNDNDLDNDGIDNDSDVDDDNDGLHDDVDSDDDNDGIDDEGDSSNTSTNIILPTAYTADAGRLLGSQCAQCHGTNGISTNEWDSIAGEDNLLDEIYEDDEPIMSAQAHGYTEEEIILIGNWLKTLKNTND